MTDYCPNTSNNVAHDPHGNASTNCTQATASYFEDVYGRQEAIELTNIDDPRSTVPNYRRLQIALNDAKVYLDNIIKIAPPAGKIALIGSYRRDQATLARCYLDSLRPRAHVMQDCARVKESLNLWASQGARTSSFAWQEASSNFNNCDVGAGMVRVDIGRGRYYTNDSMENWETLCGGNSIRKSRASRRSTVPDFRHRLNTHQPVEQMEASTPELEALYEVNQLADALESTVSLQSLPEVDDTPENGELVINEDQLTIGESY